MTTARTSDDYNDLDRAHSDDVVGSSLSCSCCHLSSPFDGFDECLSCAIAYEIHEERGATMATWRRLNAGTAWLEAVEAEFARQMTALASVSVPNMRVRQAG